MQTADLPVLLLTFNRPNPTRVVLERIIAAGITRLYVHSDAARPQKPGEVEQVAAVRALFDDLPRQMVVTKLFRDKNYGLRDGLYGAISWFFEQEECGLILEDDCVPDLTAFRFCAELLDVYRSDARIMHIGCSNLLAADTAALPASYVFTQLAFVWGWAGWRRAWQKMSLELAGLEQLTAARQFQELTTDPQAQTYLLDKFWTTRHRENNSWAYAWVYSILKNNGLCVVPTVNLVQNVGIGTQNATNTTEVNPLAGQAATPVTFPLIHPSDVAADRRLDTRFFYATQKRQFRLRIWSVLRWLRASR
jgi:hypothetical protein